MAGFELSYMTTGASTAAFRTLAALVDGFNRRHAQAGVQVHTMHWPSAWQELMRAAIYRAGPDLFEIGAPWTADFVAMNSLRAFEPAEIDRLGGKAAFAPNSWTNCQVSGSERCWGIPARVDVRVIYYWRDMLDQAGLDPQTAFATPDQFADSMARLRAAGFETPFTTQIDAPRANVYHAASWIWGAGGELVEPDGSIAFHRPAAQDGLTRFFQLFPYMPAGEADSDATFLARRAAVAMAGPWLAGRLRRSDVLPWSPELDERLGVALPPGPSFVGGTNWCIWNHARPETVQTALALATYLLNSSEYPQHCLETDMLPPRRLALAGPALRRDPRYTMMVEALRRGRAHASAHLWVLLAERLGSAMMHIWNCLREDPAQDVPALVREATGLAAERLAQALAV